MSDGTIETTTADLAVDVDTSKATGLNDDINKSGLAVPGTPLGDFLIGTKNKLLTATQQVTTSLPVLLNGKDPTGADTILVAGNQDVSGQIMFTEGGQSFVVVSVEYDPKADHTLIRFAPDSITAVKTNTVKYSVEQPLVVDTPAPAPAPAPAGIISKIMSFFGA